MIGVPFEFWGINPETGKLRWFAEVMETDQYSSSVVAADGVVYGIEGRGGGSVAVRAGGSGDITDSNTVWSGNDSARFGSPLVLDGKIYFFSNGVAKCISATDGNSVFEGRLPGAGGGGGADRGGGRSVRGPGAGGRPSGGPGGFGGRGGGFGALDYASPVAADGKVYYVQSDGTTYVIRAGDTFDLLATNKVTDDTESFGGSPAISDGKIFLRSDKHLYCIAP